LPTHDLFIALGVPAGQYLMPDGTHEYQVFYGDDVWTMAEEEYRQWNSVRQTPSPVTTADSLVLSLYEDGAFFRYDPATPDQHFMRHHRVAPMGRPLGPLPDNPNQYLIVTTNARQNLTCDTDLARIWLGWWKSNPLIVLGESSSEDVWRAIPWALSNNLGYLIPCSEVR